jgi:LEA14-like dessication related protein
MRTYVLPGVFLLFAAFILLAGCSSEPPLKQPTVTVTDIALSDVSLSTMTVNATVNIDNPNPVGATLNRVAFDVYYRDGTDQFLGHGEKTAIQVREKGNTTVVIPVRIGTVPAVKAVGSLVRDGTLTLKVNGTAALDLKVTSYNLPFSREQVFRAEEFTGLIPEVTVAGMSVNATEVLGRGREVLGALLE